MTNEQWKNLQQFSAHKEEEKKVGITGFEAFFISFFMSFYIIAATVAFAN